MSSSSGSKWMSEAFSATAWPRMLFTSLMTGPSWAEARRSVISAGPSSSDSSSSSAIASATVLCIVLSFVITPSMSSADATATAQLSPVAICTSSSANRLVGSAIASRRVLSSMNETGSTWCRRADLAGTRLAAPISTLKSARST